MVGWHHQINEHEFEQAPGDVGEKGSLACCSPWGRRVEHNLAMKQHISSAITMGGGVVAFAGSDLGASFMSGGQKWMMALTFLVY